MVDDKRHSPRRLKTVSNRILQKAEPVLVLQGELELKVQAETGRTRDNTTVFITLAACGQPLTQEAVKTLWRGRQMDSSIPLSTTLLSLLDCELESSICPLAPLAI